MLAQIAERHPLQLVVREQRGRRLRGEHLATVARRHDPRGAMHAHPVVTALVGQDRLARVHPYTDAKLSTLGPGVRRERSLPLDCRCRGVTRAGEDVEESVALGVHLLATMQGE